MIKKIIATLLILMPFGVAHAGQNKNIPVEELCMYTLAIKFDHASGSDADGINIRKDYENDLEHVSETGDGEWVYSNTPANIRNEPAMYKANITPKIKVKFQLTTTQSSNRTIDYPITVKIKALGTGDLEGELDVLEMEVTFGGPTSQWEEFTLSSKSHEWDGDTDMDIAKVEGSLQWYIEHEAASSAEQESGPHTLYTVLEDGPQAPWDDGTTAHEPWVSALEYAVPMADGKYTEEETLQEITQGIFDDDSGVWHHNSHEEDQDDANTPANNGYFAEAAGALDYTNFIAKNDDSNSQDAAAGIVVTGRLVGVADLEYNAIVDMGLINAQNLYGTGSCNNPFYAVMLPAVLDAFGIEILPIRRKYESALVVSTSSINRDDDTNGFIDRSFWHFHAAAVHSDKVYDAIMGPQKGSGSRTQYMATMQDTTDPDNDIQNVKLVLAGDGSFGGANANFVQKTISTIN